MVSWRLAGGGERKGRELQSKASTRCHGLSVLRHQTDAHYEFVIFSPRLTAPNNVHVPILRPKHFNFLPWRRCPVPASSATLAFERWFMQMRPKYLADCEFTARRSFPRHNNTAYSPQHWPDKIKVDIDIFARNTAHYLHAEGGWWVGE